MCSMLSSENSLLIQEYYKSNNFSQIMDEFTAMYSLGNAVCGDTIVVYLDIKDQKIAHYSYAGEPSQITKAAAEFIGEFIVGMEVTDILNLDANWVRSEGFEVSHRRIRSSISALLATRNAIHTYLNDGIIDEYEDLIG